MGTIKYIKIEENSDDFTIWKAKVAEHEEKVQNFIINNKINRPSKDNLLKSYNLGYSELIVKSVLENNSNDIKNDTKKEYFSHSSITSTIIKKNIKTPSPYLQNFLNEENYCDSLDKTNIKDGLVSPNNMSLTYKYKEHELHIDNQERLYLRNRDAESKMIECILNETADVSDLEGTLTIFTALHPCLSCSNKILEFTYIRPNIDVTVKFLEYYGDSKVNLSFSI